MIVYRFERNGIGPYVGHVDKTTVSIFYGNQRKTRTQKKAHNILEEKLRCAASDYRHKAWCKAHEKKEYMYGCSSKEQLRTYFAGNFKPLFKQGYRIKRYKVPDEEIIDIYVEVAFPVKYHKLQTVKKIKEVSGFY